MKKRPHFENINYMNTCKIIVQFPTEVNIKLCPYIKKIISSHNSKSIVYRVQYSHRQIFQETHFLGFYSLRCTSHGVCGLVLSF
jgi:hypothetical protein